METAISKYKLLLGIGEAEFHKIDHNDAIIALVYKVIRPAGPPLILKICASEQDYRRELHLLTLLASSLPVPAVVGTIAPSLENPGAILMECLEGDLLRPHDWNASLSYEVGAVLAQLHLNRTSGYGDLATLQSLSLTASPYFEEKFSEELCECESHLPSPLIERCRRYLASRRNLLDAVDGPCLIHRDFRPGNIIVHKGRLKGIIDWTAARSGFAEQDFCPMEQGQWPNQPEHKNALLDGYASIRTVPDYKHLMPLLQLGRALAVVGFCVKSSTWNKENAQIYRHNRHFLENFSFST
jgi:aminoglycoside phosphotransferase (APT) family kinase protein